MFLVFVIIGLSLTIPFYHVNEVAVYATHLVVPKNFSSYEDLICPQKCEEKEIFYVLYAQLCIIKYSYSRAFYERFILGFQIFNFFSVYNCCYFLIAASSTLKPPSRQVWSTQVWSAKLLADRAASARNLLFIGSLFLTIEIIFEFTLDIWLGSLIKEGDLLRNYRNHTIGIIIYHGFWYTLSLLSVFLVLDRFFMKHSCKLARITNHYGIQKSWTEWAQEQGFIIFGKGSTYRLVGALSPVLTSAIGTFVETIIKGVT